MFNIIKIPQNYFARELLSNVEFHCIVSHWEVSCSGKYSTGPVLPLCSGLFCTILYCTYYFQACDQHPDMAIIFTTSIS